MSCTLRLEMAAMIHLHGTLVLLLAAGASPRETGDAGGLQYRLEQLWRTGVDLDVTEEDSLLLLGHQTVGARRTPFSQSVVRRGVCRVRVLAVDRRGRPTRMTRRYRHASLVMGGTQAAGDSFCSHHGKTVVITPEGATVDGRALPILERNTFRYALSAEARNRLFPDRPVSVGEKWTPNLGSVVRWLDLEPYATGACLCRLEAVEPAGDDRVARVRLTGSVEQRHGAALMTMRLEGRLDLLVGAGRVTRLEVTGQVRLDGGKASEGGAVEAAGTWYRLRLSRPATDAAAASAAPKHAHAPRAPAPADRLGPFGWRRPARTARTDAGAEGMEYAIFPANGKQAVGQCRVRLRPGSPDAPAELARFRLGARARRAEVLSTSTASKANGLTVVRLMARYEQDGAAWRLMACSVFGAEHTCEFVINGRQDRLARLREWLDTILDSITVKPK